MSINMNNIFDMNMFLDSLKVMGLGMLGIFIVIGLITLIVLLLNKIFNK